MNQRQSSCSANLLSSRLILSSLSSERILCRPYIKISFDGLKKNEILMENETQKIKHFKCYIVHKYTSISLHSEIPCLTSF